MIAAVLGLALLSAGPDPRPVVRHPALDGLEPAVAAQLQKIREGVEGESTPSAEIYGRAGCHYHAYSMTAAAEDAYGVAERLAPREYRWTYLRALLLEQDNRLPEAARAYADALEKAAYYPALVRLAAVKTALGQSAEAELAVARRHAPDDPSLLAVAGEQALFAGRAEEAASLLAKALAREPRATRLHYPLAMAYRALGRADDAKTELARVGTAGIRPKDPLFDEVLALRRGSQVYVLEAERAAKAGDFEAAASAFRRAITASSQPDTSWLLGLAAAETSLARYDDALAHLQEAGRARPGNPLVLYNTGVLLAHLGRYAEAEGALRAVLERQPEDGAARRELVVVLLSLGRSDAAEAVAREGRGQAGFCAELRSRLDAARAAARLALGPLRECATGD
jgi:tetratricopeptide (TPR) repeat protein